MDLGLKNKVALVAAGSRDWAAQLPKNWPPKALRSCSARATRKTLAEVAATIADNSGAHVLAVPADVTIARRY